MPTVNSRPTPAELETARAIVIALQDVSDYTPTNPAYSATALRELADALSRAEEAELRAKRALEVAREQAVDAARKLHRSVLETKVQVVAQYGSDSPVVHAVGLKRRSERRRGTRRSSTTA
jgi:hypothetical protein